MIMKTHIIKLLLLVLTLNSIGCGSSSGAGDVLMFSTDYGLGIINGTSNRAVLNDDTQTSKLHFIFVVGKTLERLKAGVGEQPKPPLEESRITQRG